MKRRVPLILVVLFASVAPFAFFVQMYAADVSPDVTPIAPDRGAAGLERGLRSLQTRASLLMITAHPDDEDGGMLAYESRGQGARSALLTLNRGEGGQNAVSDDSYDALGLLRTQELLEADRYYGVDQYWGSVIDYGFSKTREEAWQKWGHDRVLGEAVRVIRETRPLVVTSVFAGAPTDGHGNHQVAGQVAQEAFLAAGDPKQFPDQIRAGLRPWFPVKVYERVPFFRVTKQGMYDYATDEWVPARFFDYVHKRWIEGEPSTDVTIPEGTFSPVNGLTYLQIGRIGLSYQRTQNHGGMVPPPAAYGSSYHRYGSLIATGRSEKSFFDGVDTSLSGIESLAPGQSSLLHSGLATLQNIVVEANEKYKADAPAAIAPVLASALKTTRDLEKAVQSSTIREPGKSDVLFELHVKEQQIEKTLSLALGLYFVSVTKLDSSMAVPGQKFTLQAHAADLGTLPVTLTAIDVLSPRGEDWQPRPAGATHAVLAADGHFEVAFQVAVPQHADVTRPYFSRKDEEQPFYTLTDARWLTHSTAPYPLEALATFEYEGETIHLRTVVQATRTEGTGGTLSDPLLVGPAMSVEIAQRAGAVPVTAHSFPVTCMLRSNVKDATGVLRLHLPSGWRSQPEQHPFQLPREGDAETVTFQVSPTNLKATSYSIEAVADMAGQTYEEGYRMVGYTGLRSYPYYQPATYKAVGVDVAIPAGLHVAFVPGTGDDVPSAMVDLGAAVDILAPQDLATVDFSRFDAVVLGVRAYGVRPELRAANDRLLAYVKAGGTLVVQYNWQNFDRNYGPYPFDLGKAAKVVDETAAVEILKNSPVFDWPNKITASDFTGWQEERGHGFLATWDSRYNALTETHDPGQLPQKGGLVLARYGKGVYIYDALALHRQLPAGVPGAYRILANLISAGKNPKW